MSLKGKVANTKPTSLLSDGFSNGEVIAKSAKENAKTIYDLPVEERGEVFLRMLENIEGDDEICEKMLKNLRQLRGDYND